MKTVWAGINVKWERAVVGGVAEGGFDNDLSRDGSSPPE
jgi:hypothetical protein